MPLKSVTYIVKDGRLNRWIRYVGDAHHLPCGRSPLSCCEATTAHRGVIPMRIERAAPLLLPFLASCSFVIAKSPPTGWNSVEGPPTGAVNYCSPIPIWAAVDVLLALTSIGSSYVATVGTPKPGKPLGGATWPGVLGAAVFGTSAVVGFNRAKNCERFLFFDDLYQAQLEAATTTTTIITTTTTTTTTTTLTDTTTTTTTLTDTTTTKTPTPPPPDGKEEFASTSYLETPLLLRLSTPTIGRY